MVVPNKSPIDQKARCPKCTALVREPPDGVYKCSICSTLLVARGTCSENKLGGASGVPLEVGIRNGLEQPSCKDNHFSHQASSMDPQAHALQLETMGETRRYPSRKTPPSSTSSRSGEGSDRSDRGRSSIFSGSYTGSEGGNHSLPWLSSRPVPDVDTLTGQAVVDHIRTVNQRRANLMEANGKGNVRSNVISPKIMVSMPSGGSYHANADQADEDMVKFMIAGTSNGFSKGPTFSHFSKRGMKPKRVEREHLCLPLSPRSLCDSSHASNAFHSERLCIHSTGLPTAMQAQSITEQDALHQYNKLDAEQCIFLCHRYAHQGSSKPFAQPCSNSAPHKCACPQSEEYVGIPCTYKTNGDPHRATFNGSTEVTYSEQTSSYLLYNVDGQNGLPRAGPQGSWDTQSHSDDLYSYGIPQQTTRNRASATLHDPGVGADSHHAGSLYAPVPACTSCDHHVRATPQPYLPQKSKHNHHAFSFSQPVCGAHQEEGQSIHDDQSRRGNQDVLLHRKSGPTAQHACLLAGKEKSLPPLPWSGAPPYVLCQRCFKVLQVPKYVHESAIQRLRCNACKKVSKFSVATFVHNQMCMAHGHARHPSYTGNGGPTIKAQHDLRLTVGEKHLLYSPSQTACAAWHPEGAMDTDLALEVPNSSSDNHNMVGLRGLPAGGVEDAGDMGGMCPPGSTTAILQGQQGDLSCNQLLDGLEDSDTSAGKLYNPEARVDLVSQVKVPSEEGGKPLMVPGLEVGGLREGCDSMARFSLSEMKDIVTPREGYENVTIAPGAPPMVGDNQNNKQDGVEASDNCMSSTPLSPAPGSPLYEHLSYGTGSSDTGERTVEKGGNGGGAGIEVVQEVSKGTKSLTGLLKRSIREFGKGGQGNNKTGSVVVNGQTISQAAIESAEKQAGKIHPGTYWYDYHAGFWGVMGGPCLGIIPPMIEEMKIPLTRGSAGGNTGILINGRELHKRDLEALVGRGMPRTPGKAYTVDINGHIVDQESGKVLKSLGRLAPTIQRRGRGCGMYQPTTRT